MKLTPLFFTSILGLFLLPCIAQAAASVNRSTCKPTGQPDCKSVVRYGNSNAHNGTFNLALAENKAPGTIVTCRRLIDLPTGTTAGNHSFGGDCTLKSRRSHTQVLICHDTMVGHFAIKKLKGQNALSEQVLIAFTDEQCFGG